MALVSVDADGVHSLAGSVVNPQMLVERLPENANLVLRLAPDLAVDTMVGVIDSLREQGIERLSYLPQGGP